ncbi:MAG: TOBE domain-containing protein [Deltaproteobacteria bacterium]|nr:TOBE domain-containing protein [Deltaproteobacteria bacterium]
MTRRKKVPLEVSGAIWIGKTDAVFLGSDRIGLLEKIEEHGSITKAARAAGISYKTAWDAVSAMNNLSDKPLVERTTGGRGGGGTVLTGEGKEVVRRYRILQREHQSFVGGLSERIGDFHNFYRFLRRISMKVSARNTFAGKVSSVRKGVVSAEVMLSLKGGDTVVAVITKESAENLGLRKGSEVYAIIKASSVMLGKDLHDTRISARNLLCGTVEKLAEGPVNEDVTVRLSGGNLLTSVITRESAGKLELKPGDHVCAVIKASSVILGVSE